MAWLLVWYGYLSGLVTHLVRLLVCSGVVTGQVWLLVWLPLISKVVSTDMRGKRGG